jgi:hypothetical protein
VCEFEFAWLGGHESSLLLLSLLLLLLLSELAMMPTVYPSVGMLSLRALVAVGRDAVLSLAVYAWAGGLAALGPLGPLSDLRRRLSQEVGSAALGSLGAVTVVSG